MICDICGNWFNRIGRSDKYQKCPDCKNKQL